MSRIPREKARLIAAPLLQREWREQELAVETTKGPSAKETASGGEEAQGAKAAGETRSQEPPARSQEPPARSQEPPARSASAPRPGTRGSPISRSAAAQKAYEILKAEADADADVAASLSKRQARASGGGDAPGTIDNRLWVMPSGQWPQPGFRGPR